MIIIVIIIVAMLRHGETDVTHILTHGRLICRDVEALWGFVPLFVLPQV